MEKQRGFKTIAIVALVVSVFGVSIAFASMSTLLTIGGTVKMETAKWEVKFADVQLTDPNNIVAGGYTIEDTSITGIDITLAKPGDIATFEFDVVNSGTLDATLSGLHIEELTCTGTEGATSPETDANTVCDNLVYTLTYDTADGSKVVQGADLARNNGTAHMVLTIGYKTDAKDLPEKDVTISDIDIQLTYSQK